MKRELGADRGAIGVRWIAFGIFFLATPYFNLIDILPDAIGYLLILKGLGECIYTVPSFGGMAKKMRILIGISIARPIAFLLVAYFSGASENQSEAPTMSLLLVFSLLLAEGYIVWQMIGEAFAGITHTVLETECSDIGLKLTKLRRKTRRFFAFKALGNLLPELAVLGVTEEGYIGSVTENETQIYLQLRNVLTVLFFVVVLIASIFFLCAWFDWLKKVRKNQAYLPALTEMIHRSPEPHERRLVRTAGTGTLLLTAGAFLLWSVRMDGRVMIPTFLGALAIGYALRYFAENPPVKTRQTMLWVVFAVFSGGTWLSQNLFASRYYDSGSARGAESWFRTNVALTVLGGVMLFILLQLLRTRLCAYLDTHGFAIIEPTFVRTAKEVENRRQALKTRVSLVCLTALVPIACETVEAATLFAKEINFNVLGAQKGLPVWGILVAIRLVWAVFASDCFVRVRSAVRERYAEHL